MRTNNDDLKDLISYNDMSTNSEKRQFERFPIDFEIEVACQDRDAQAYGEKTVLQDISGEGVTFLSSQSERYFMGQPLELRIWLPGNDEVKAAMKGNAKVVRIGPCSNKDLRGRSSAICVAVELDEPLHFESYITHD